MIKKINDFIKFLSVDIWNIRLSDLRSRKAILYRYLRVLILSVRRFVDDNLQYRASALTFFSMLSVVPVLALGFGIAKGFGYQEYLQAELSNNLKGH